ncbi:MAG: hypothetical protein L3J00_01920 [Thiomicrorhabdus sp.]|nr:hypothetical protein [Thiomicrorhabdus sp.]
MNTKTDNVNAPSLYELCFMFHENDIKITVKSSVISGLESVYVNDKLMSKKRTFKRNSRHIFHISGIEYQVLFKTEILKGQIKCTFFKNGQMIKSYTALPKGNNYVKFAWYGLIGFAVGILSSYLSWPFWASALILLFVISLAYIREIKRVTIKENYI